MHREAYRVIAPFTQGARDISGLLPRVRSDAFSDQVADVVAAQGELSRQKKDKKESLLSRALANTALGVGVGAALGAVKSIPITRDAWNPHVAATTAALSGATALAFTLARHALAPRLTSEAQETVDQADPAVRYVAGHHATQEKAQDWERAKWAPYMAGESGAILGGLGSLAGAWAMGKPNSWATGLTGAGIGAAAGLGLGYLYRKHKQRQFLEHVENELHMSQSPKAQEAAVQAEVEQDPMLKAAEEVDVELDAEGNPRKKKGVPSEAGLYAGVAGLGGAALLATALSSSDMGKIKSFRDSMARIAQHPNPATDVNDYARAGHEVAKIRPFFMNMTDVMRVGRAFYPSTDPRSWKPTSGEHYDAFQKSPFHAYTQLLHEVGDYSEGRGTQDKELLRLVSQRSDAAPMEAAGHLQGVSPEAKTELATKLRQHLEGVNTYGIADKFQSSREALLQAAADYAAPHAAAGTSPTYVGFKEYIASRRPELVPAKYLFDSTIAAGLPEKAKRYSEATYLADQVRPWLIGAAGVAGVAGAAGLGYWLYKRQKEKAESEGEAPPDEATQTVDPPIQFPQEQLEKAAMSMLKEALVTGSKWPVVASNAPLMKGKGGPPERYASSKDGARIVHNYGLGAIEAWKNEGKPLLEKHETSVKSASDADSNAHGEERDDVNLGICRVLEEQYGSKVPESTAPSSAATEEVDAIAVPNPPESTPSTSEAPSSAAGSDASPSSKVAEDRSSLPYRKRVEVYAMKDGKIYGGVYKDGGFGVFGGGIDDDDIATAASREFEEETGLTAKNVKLLPIEPVAIDWNPPYKSSKQAERAKSFRGAQTFFVVADLDDSNPKPKAPGDDGKSPLRWPRLFTIPEATEFCEKATATEDGVKRINAARVKVLKHLQGLEKTADAAQFLPRKEVLMFTPDGKIAIRRGTNRRFELPSDVEGKPVPYEQPVQLLPEGGVPEKGIHGYQVALQSAEGDLPEGFEGVDPQDALKDLYAALGKPENRAWQSLDRARARALLRLVKRRTPAPAVV